MSGSRSEGTAVLTSSLVSRLSTLRTGTSTHQLVPRMPTLNYLQYLSSQSNRLYFSRYDESAVLHMQEGLMAVIRYHGSLAGIVEPRHVPTHTYRRTNEDEGGRLFAFGTRRRGKRVNIHLSIYIYIYLYIYTHSRGRMPLLCSVASNLRCINTCLDRSNVGIYPYVGSFWKPALTRP